MSATPTVQSVTPTFRDLVEELWSEDHQITAKKIADRLKLSTEARKVLMPVIGNSCRIVHREVARHIEHSYDPSVDRAIHPDADTIEERTKFLGSWFMLGTTGEKVYMADATVAQHRARIEFLDSLRIGITQTINMHLAVIVRITEAGVTCFGDLFRPPPSAAA